MLLQRRCSQMAAQQYGIITRRQMLGAGLTPRQAERMVTGSRWRPVLPGTYVQATASTSLQQRVMAAVQWAGASAAASFETACALRRFANSLNEPVEVSCPRRLRSEQVVTHRVQPWGPGEIERAHGIPITSMERTLVDMAGRELAPSTRLCAARSPRSLGSTHTFRRLPAAADMALRPCACCCPAT
jgi:predicted transcriptional regulator of viral defense system